MQEQRVRIAGWCRVTAKRAAKQVQKVRFTKSASENLSETCESMLYFATCSTKRNFEMSCFLLSDRHHASIAHYVAECNMWPDAKIQSLANKLKRCNIASVNYRYDRQTPARKCKIEHFQQLDAKSFYDAIRCWTYQSCDNPDNVECDILRAFLFSLAHPGYSPDMLVDQWCIN